MKIQMKIKKRIGMMIITTLMKMIKIKMMMIEMMIEEDEDGDVNCSFQTQSESIKCIFCSTQLLIISYVNCRNVCVCYTC